MSSFDNTRDNSKRTETDADRKQREGNGRPSVQPRGIAQPGAPSAPSGCGCSSAAAGSIAASAFGTPPPAPASASLNSDSGNSGGCGCSGAAASGPTVIPGPLPVKLLLGAVLAALWYAAYSSLPGFADYLTASLLGLDLETHFGQAVRFFLYDTPKVFLLLIGVIFVVGIIRTFFSPERTRAILAGRNEAVGNVLAALLGVVTPFCSCSAVPLFIGFVTAGVPLGVTFSFLIAAPMVNEIALVLLYGLFGAKVAVLYLVTGLGIAIVAGWVIGRLGMEEHIEDWVRLATAESGSSGRLSADARILAGAKAVREIIAKVWPWVTVGIAVGAGVHGYVPEGVMASVMGREAWWSVPLAVVLGIPMYTNAAGVIPVVSALLGKGAALGTALAFMMSVIALSFPEMVILRKVLKPKLIGVFVGVVATGILLVGFLFNAVL